MSLPPDEIEQVRKLINSILDEGATPERMQTLMKLLNHNQKVCEAYLDFMMIHGYLQRQLSGTIPEDSIHPELKEISSKRTKSRLNIMKYFLATPFLALGSLERTIVLKTSLYFYLTYPSENLL